MENYNEINEKVISVYREMTKVRKEIVEEIHNHIKERGGEIRFELDIDRELDRLEIYYDGGNHPEYATNPFSSVYAVKATVTHKDGKDIKSFDLEIEETNEYEEDRLLFDDVCNLFDFIQSYETLIEGKEN